MVHGKLFLDMKVMVAVKRVIDPYVTVRVRSDNLGVETLHVKHSMNPFDEIALEEAVRCLENNTFNDVLLVSIGPSQNKEVLMHGLALGASRAMLIETNRVLQGLPIAKILSCIAQEEQPDLIVLGKQAIDADGAQTAAMLSALLGWPQALGVSSLRMDESRYVVSCETDSGSETWALQRPAVISVDLRLNQPRHVGLMQIMKAKQKPFFTRALDELAIHIEQQTQVLGVRAASRRTKGIKVDSVGQLVDKLRYEANVL